MKKLSQQAFQTAQFYVETHGRAVDQARFALHFADGDPTHVLSALAFYQNDDGGFGHALEPDLRTPASSAISTQQGFNILHEVGTTSTEPLVQQAVTYLLDTLDKESLRWEIVPAAVEDAPHAPWWTYAKIQESFGGFLANPRAALIGFLHEHQTLVPAAMLAQLLEAQLAHLAAESSKGENKGEIDMHDLHCYVTLATSPNLPDQYRQQLTATLLNAVQGIVTTDPADFDKYQLMPLDVAPTPDALLASAAEQNAIDAQLDQIIATQLLDGSWALPWSWDFVDQAAWAQAERDWKGTIVVSRLKTLAAYGRIAG